MSVLDIWAYMSRVGSKGGGLFSMTPLWLLFHWAYSRDWACWARHRPRYIKSGLFLFFFSFLFYFFNFSFRLNNSHLLFSGPKMMFLGALFISPMWQATTMADTCWQHQMGAHGSKLYWNSNTRAPTSLQTTHVHRQLLWRNQSHIAQNKISEYFKEIIAKRSRDIRI